MTKKQTKRISVPYDMQWKELVTDFLPDFVRNGKIIAYLFWVGNFGFRRACFLRA